VDPDSLDPAFQVNPDTDPDPDTDPNPIRIQGFDDKNLRENIKHNFFKNLL
jgi:hypothetical protein